MDWSTPESIDPLNEHIGDFLDVDLRSYEQSARQAYQNQEYRLAAQYYLFILRHKYDDARIIYNLACCYGLMNKGDLAALYLRRAIDAGFDNYIQILSDADFRPVEKDHTMQKVMAEIDTKRLLAGQVLYIAGSKLLPCRLHLPAIIKPDKAYTLLIGLHGNGGNSEDMASIKEYFKNQDFIYAAPEGPYVVPQGLYKHADQFSWGIQTTDKELWQRGDPLTFDYILNIVHDMRERYKIGDVYLLGHSQGAAFAVNTAILFPEIFRGVIAFAGILPTPDKPFSFLDEANFASAKNLRIFIAHGYSDAAITIDESRTARDYLMERGYDVTFHEFFGGHGIPDDVFVKAIKWMQAK